MIMLVHLLLVLAFFQVDPYRERIDKGVTFPDAAEINKWSEKSEWHKKAIAKALDRAAWADALRGIETRAGLKAEHIEIKVRFATITDPAAARAGGRGGKGNVDFDADKLAVVEKTVAEFEKLRKEGATIVVPPARTERIIHHELVHCFQGVDQPSWALEGMASWLGRDANHICGYRESDQKTLAVDEEIPHEWVYARGWAFFEWLESRHGADRVRKFIAKVIEGARIPDAAAEITGQTWAQLKTSEREWSTAWIKAFKADK